MSRLEFEVTQLNILSDLILACVIIGFLYAISIKTKNK